jgi:hypothetical protein
MRDRGETKDMGKKVVQVPMQEDLLAALGKGSRNKDRPHLEVSRDARWPVLGQREEKPLDREYEEGYRQIPEAPTLAEAAAIMAGEVLDKETW